MFINNPDYFHIINLDGLILLFPTGFNILCLGCSHHSTKTMMDLIVSNILTAATSTIWKEDVLALLVRKKIQLTSFGILHFGFDYCSTVSFWTLRIIDV